MGPRRSLRTSVILRILQKLRLRPMLLRPNFQTVDLFRCTVNSGLISLKICSSRRRYNTETLANYLCFCKSLQPDSQNLVIPLKTGIQAKEFAVFGGAFIFYCWTPGSSPGMTMRVLGGRLCGRLALCFSVQAPVEKNNRTEAEREVQRRKTVGVGRAAVRQEHRSQQLVHRQNGCTGA